MSAVRVIGIGSPHGADRAGWLAIDALGRSGLAERYLPGSLSLHQCRTPAALHQVLAGSRRAIVIDALPDGSVSLLQLSPQQLQAHADRTSVHGIGVGEMLALVAALEAHPPAVTVLGIGIAPDASPTAVEQLIASLLPELSLYIEQVVADDLAAPALPLEKRVGTPHN